MTAPALILHVGAPKCGSSALQTALSAQPDLRDGAGGRLRYVGIRGSGAGIAPIQGLALRLAARRSVHGYVSWPNIGPGTDAAALSRVLGQVIGRGRRRGHVPILSCEGWIAQPAWFDAILADLGHPPVRVVAYLRPPVDWINAAWWQWGIWGADSLDTWLNRGDMVYRFGPLLEAWAAIPGVDLRIRSARQDVVADFAALTGTALPAVGMRNPAAPVSLTGFLLRNRRFRPTGHDAAVEFVVQRWCPPTGEPRAWAVLPRHVHRLRPLAIETRKRIAPLLDRAGAEVLFADPRWQSEAVYHQAIMAGPSRPHDPAALPGLHAALAAGLARVSQTLGLPPPALPAAPGAEAAIADWDTAVSHVLETLLARDEIWRSGPAGRLAAGLRRFRAG